jgi:hypothetical protein
MPTDCYDKTALNLLPRKRVEVAFDGGNLTSDAGLLLLAQLDRQVGLTDRLAQCLIDRRQHNKTRFTHPEMLRQRILALAAGYEDTIDHNTLCADPALKVAAGRQPRGQSHLAGQSTLSRFENRVTRRELRDLGYAFVDFFIDQHAASPPGRIILDFDATDDPTHGQQEFAEFHGFYDCHCYVPLFVTALCDDGSHEPVMALLRPGRSHAARSAPALFRRLIQRLKHALPKTAILFRADSGFAIPKLYDACEDHGVQYGIGLPTNPVLQRLALPVIDQAYERFFATGETVQVFGDFFYQAETWRHPRRVVCKAEIIAAHRDDLNLRFVVTNDMHRSPEAAYKLYIQRGDMESRVDELKNDCFSGRTSCHRFLPNQFRLFLALAAYWLFVLLRQRLARPELRVAQVQTLRMRLVKVAARVIESVRRVRFALPTPYPWIDDWLQAAVAVGGGV